MAESIKTAIRKKAAEFVARTKNKPKKSKVAIIFPGQGFQKLGMALPLRPDTRDRLFKLMQEVLRGDILFVNRLIRFRLFSLPVFTTSAFIIGSYSIIALCLFQGLLQAVLF